MKRILFICTGNSCRSQMAEAFANTLGSHKVRALSAGVSPIDITETTKLVMNEVGIDLSSHHSKDVNTFTNDRFDYVITLSRFADNVCGVYDGGGIRRFWDIEDPYKVILFEEEVVMKKFREVRDAIKIKVMELLEGIPDL